MESDCLAAIQAIRSRTPMASPLGKMIHACGDLLVELNTVFLFFIGTHARAMSATHSLANNIVCHKLIVPFTKPVPFIQTCHY